VLPGDLDVAVTDWLQTQNGDLLRAKSGELTEKYRQGGNSRHVDLAAYLTTRMPATYAAISRVLTEVANVAPEFAPQSMLDIGAGPGTATWAALQQWPDMASVTMIEPDTRFVELAKSFAAQSNIPALSSASITRAKLNEADAKADLVIAAYVFAELVEKEAGQTALKLWQQTHHTLIIIEPGTPRGFARIELARKALTKAGAHMIGPCTHSNTCPMTGSEWCRFTQRLARSREHMHAKQATVSFEDESFSWIAVSRVAVKLPLARIIAPVEIDKHSLTLKLCGTEGLTTGRVARRDKAAYKLHRKLAWGDALPPPMDDQDV